MSGNPNVLPITGLVPMLHVSDMERSIAFYQHLGLEVGNREPKIGPLHWCWLYAPKAADWKRGPNIMLATSECAINAEQQQALFYLYAADLVALRHQLLTHGLKPGEIKYPAYLPKGEFQLRDPDDYCLMIAQSAPDTP